MTLPTPTQISIHQVLGVIPHADGSAGMPLTRHDVG